MCPVCLAAPGGTCHNRTTAHPERVYAYAATTRHTPVQLPGAVIAFARQVGLGQFTVELSRLDGKWLAHKTGSSAPPVPVAEDTLRALIAYGLLQLSVRRERGKAPKPMYLPTHGLNCIQLIISSETKP